MARLTPEDVVETPKKHLALPTTLPNLLPGAVGLFLVLLGQVSVLSDSYPVRIGAVLVALTIVFLAGTRFGRAEQARELLLREKS